MPEPRLIKKYPSRRLYDLEQGRFVTLAELFELIRGGGRIRAIDAQGRDITRSLLLQILAEQEEGRDPPLLSAEVLHEMVGMYGNVMQALFARFIDEGMAGLIRQQARLRGNLGAVVERSTAVALNGLLEHQAELWRTGQRLVSGLIRSEKELPRESPKEPPQKLPQEPPEEPEALPPGEKPPTPRRKRRP